MLTGESLCRGDKFLERELLIHRHNLITNLVGRAVQTDGKAEAQRLLGELEDLGDHA